MTSTADGPMLMLDPQALSSAATRFYRLRCRTGGEVVAAPAGCFGLPLDRSGASFPQNITQGSEIKATMERRLTNTLASPRIPTRSGKPGAVTRSGAASKAPNATKPTPPGEVTAA